MSLSSLRRLTKENTHLISLVVLCVSSFLLVWPEGDFPLGDDWSYGKAVQNLAVHGNLQFTGWTSMPLLTQVLWGSGFVYVFGFSFTVLRVSTLVAAIIGVIGTFVFVKEVSSNSQLAFLTAINILYTPLFFYLSFSFATDVPFYALFVWCAYFYLRFLKENNIWYFFSAVILNCAAVLLRDIGISLGIAFAATYFLKKNFFKATSIRSLTILISTLLIPVLCIVVFRKWLEYNHGLPYLYDDGRQRMFKTLDSGPGFIIYYFFKNVFFSWIFVSTFLLPVSWKLFSQYLPQLLKKRLFTTGVVLYSSAVFVLLLSSNKVKMELKEYIYPPIVSPAAYEFAFLFKKGFPAILDIFLCLATTLGLFVFGCLLFSKYDNFFKTEKYRGSLWPALQYYIHRSSSEVIFLAIAIGVYITPLSIAGVYSRYLFPALFLCSGLLAFNTNFDCKRKNKVFSVSSTLILLCFMALSITGARDILTVQNARWNLLNHITKTLKISPSRVDGGFEFNGWHLYDPGYVGSPGKNWWWVLDDEYTVLQSKNEGYNILRDTTIELWLPPGETITFYAMQRKQKTGNQ